MSASGIADTVDLQLCPATAAAAAAGDQVPTVYVATSDADNEHVRRRLAMPPPTGPEIDDGAPRASLLSPNAASTDPGGNTHTGGRRGSSSLPTPAPASQSSLNGSLSDAAAQVVHALQQPQVLPPPPPPTPASSQSGAAALAVRPTAASSSGIPKATGTSDATDAALYGKVRTLSADANDAAIDGTRSNASSAGGTAAPSDAGPTRSPSEVAQAGPRSASSAAAGLRDPVLLAIALKELESDVANALGQLKTERLRSGLATRDLDAVTCENAELTAVVEDLMSDADELKDLVRTLRVERAELAETCADQAEELERLSDGAEGAADVLESLKGAVAETSAKLADTTEERDLFRSRVDDAEVRASAAETDASALRVGRVHLASVVEQQGHAISELHRAHLFDREKSARLHIAVQADNGLQQAAAIEARERCTLLTAMHQWQAERSETARLAAQSRSASDQPSQELADAVRKLKREASSLKAECASLDETAAGWREECGELQKADGVRSLRTSEATERSRIESSWSVECAAIAFIAMRCRPSAATVVAKSGSPPPPRKSADQQQQQPPSPVRGTASPSQLQLQLMSDDSSATFTASPNTGASSRFVAATGTNTATLMFANASCATPSGWLHVAAAAASSRSAPKMERVAAAAPSCCLEETSASQPLRSGDGGGGDVPGGGPAASSLSPTTIEACEDVIRELRQALTKLQAERDSLAQQLGIAEDSAALRGSDLTATRRHLHELEQVVCAVEAEKSAMRRQHDEAAKTHEATVAQLGQDLDETNALLDKYRADAKAAAATGQRDAAMIQIDLLEAQNAATAAGAEAQEAETRAIYAESELRAYRKSVEFIMAEQEQCKADMATLREDAETAQRRLFSAQEDGLRLEESRARQALQHEWAIYAAQRSFQVALRRR